MTKPIIIAVDAMGGDNAPQKVLDGIELHHNKTENIFYNIFGNKESISSILKHKKINTNNFEIIHTDKKIMGEDSALTAAKRGKDTSMWLAIESVKNKTSDIVLSAGNTGALFVIAKLNLEMINNIDKPALSGLWPNKKGINVVLDLGANIECNEKNLKDFSIMGAALHKSLYPYETTKLALLNI
jgi:glycerol-3-phosphate acyltransferase PlsX